MIMRDVYVKASYINSEDMEDHTVESEHADVTLENGMVIIKSSEDGSIACIPNDLLISKVIIVPQPEEKE